MATVGSPRSWNVGDLLTAALMNAVSTILNWLLNTSLTQVYNSLNTSIPNAAYTAVPFDTATFNNDSAWATGTNTRWTCQTQGTYRVSLQVAFANNGTGIREAQFCVNGVALQTFNSDALAGVATQCVATFSMHFNVGDYITINAYQNSGGALALSGGSLSTFLCVKWENNL